MMSFRRRKRPAAPRSVEKTLRPKKGPWSVVTYSIFDPDFVVHLKGCDSEEEGLLALWILAYAALWWSDDENHEETFFELGDDATLEAVLQLLLKKYPQPNIDWRALLPPSVRSELVAARGFEISEAWGAYLHEGSDFKWDSRSSGSRYELDCSQPLATPTPAAAATP